MQDSQASEFGQVQPGYQVQAGTLELLAFSDGPIPSSESLQHHPPAQIAGSMHYTSGQIGTSMLLSPGSKPTQFYLTDACVKSTQKRVSTFRCHTCPKTFTRRENLQSHELTHSNARPYRCELCPMAFTRPSDCQRHQNGHSGEKRFVCRGGCGKRFTRAEGLQQHFRSKIGKRCEATWNWSQQKRNGDNNTRREDLTSPGVGIDLRLPKAIAQAPETNSLLQPPAKPSEPVYSLHSTTATSAVRRNKHYIPRQGDSNMSQHTSQPRNVEATNSIPTSQPRTQGAEPLQALPQHLLDFQPDNLRRLHELLVSIAQLLEEPRRSSLDSTSIASDALRYFRQTYDLGFSTAEEKEVQTSLYLELRRYNMQREKYVLELEKELVRLASENSLSPYWWGHQPDYSHILGFANISEATTQPENSGTVKSLSSKS